MITHLAPVALAITIIACAPPKQRRAPTTDVPEDQALLAKLEGYKACLDDHSKRVFEIADGYTRRLGGREPTPEVRVPVHVSPDPKDCIEAIKQARALPPASPALEAAGAAFARAALAVHVLTEDARGRRDRPGAASDLAKDGAAHDQLIAAFREFDRAQGALFDEVRRLDLMVRRNWLAHAQQEDGPRFPLLVDVIMLRAEEMVALAATPSDQLEQLDIAAATAQLAAFEDALAEATARTFAEPKEDPAVLEGYDGLARHAQLFAIATRQLIQRAHDKLAFTDAERIMIAADNESAVVGTPGAMAGAYNKLVETYYYAK